MDMWAQSPSKLDLMLLALPSHPALKASGNNLHSHMDQQDKQQQFHHGQFEAFRADIPPPKQLPGRYLAYRVL